MMAVRHKKTDLPSNKVEVKICLFVLYGLFRCVACFVVRWSAALLTP